MQTVKINYDYDASLGIDLSKVTASVTGNTITFSLPPIEVLSDSLTPTEVQVDQVLFDLKEDRRQALQEERINVEYLYAFTGSAAFSAYVVLRVDDAAHAELVLKNAGVSTLSDAELMQLL